MDSIAKDFGVYWDNLTSEHPKIVSNEWKSRLIGKYGESQRHYHTLKHVMDMKKLKDEYFSFLSRPNLVDYAIIFHDVEYNPTKNDNEEISAELFKEFSNEVNLSPSDSELIAGWILSTKSHKTESHLNDKPGEQDIHFFLDFDMAILGSSNEEYEKYAEDIRKEYCHIPLTEYCKGRAEVLENFLKIPRIYATKNLHERFEIQARNNIVKEIHYLKSTQE